VRIDPMLDRWVHKLVDAVGEPARIALAEVMPRPVDAWTGRDVLDFVEHLRGLTGDEFMGLGAAPCPLGASDFVIDLGSRCATLREAVVRCFRFMGMVTRALAIRLVEDGDKAVIEIRQSPTPRDPGHVLADWSMLVWHKLPQALIGAEIWLDRTEFDHPLDAGYAAYAHMFGGDCVFRSDACRLVFARGYLDRRIAITPAEAGLLKPRVPDHFTIPVALTTSWKQQVCNALRFEIAGGGQPSTIDELAGEFGVSGQTLRRRLRDEGASYRGLKAEARRQVALDVLADDGATLSAASLAAGFAEPNALTRALRSSQGMSASDLRDQVRRWREPKSRALRGQVG
jgi:AraC-like DNA-binding protein